MADIFTASARPLRHDGYGHDKFTRENNSVAPINQYIKNGSSVRDLDLPVAFKIATRGMNTQQNQAPASNFSEDPASLSYSADYQTAMQIVQSLKNNELASGAEFSAQDIIDLVKKRFGDLNANIIKIVVDTLTNDVSDMKGRVAGTFPNIKLMISSRQPKFFEE